MKTSELTGAALDWAVAKCEGIGLGPRGFVVYYHEGEPSMWEPSTNWAQGGPIIERERLCVMPYNDRWMCTTNGSQLQSHSVKAETPLIAALRCYVAFKLGDEVEVPQELLGA